MSWFYSPPPPGNSNPSLGGVKIFSGNAKCFEVFFFISMAFLKSNSHLETALIRRKEEKF